MSSTFEQLLATFDELSRPEQEKAAYAVWCRVRDYGPMPEEALTQIADEAFQRLDAEESGIGQSSKG